MSWVDTPSGLPPPSLPASPPLAVTPRRRTHYRLLSLTVASGAYRNLVRSLRSLRQPLHCLREIRIDKNDLINTSLAVAYRTHLLTHWRKTQTHSNQKGASTELLPQWIKTLTYTGQAVLSGCSGFTCMLACLRVPPATFACTHYTNSIASFHILGTFDWAYRQRYLFFFYTIIKKTVEWSPNTGISFRGFLKWIMTTKHLRVSLLLTTKVLRSRSFFSPSWYHLQRRNKGNKHEPDNVKSSFHFVRSQRVHLQY